MGEIGISRHVFYHELRWWEVKAIVRGYNRRYRNMWSATRWQTYNIMSAQVGSDGMRKSNITKPTDLIEFPWERETARVNVTQSDIDEMQAFMNSINTQQQDISNDN